MKILKDSEWSLIGQMSCGFVFKHKVYNQIIIVEKAKFVLTQSDSVMFCDVTASVPVSLSKSKNGCSFTEPQNLNFDNFSELVSTLFRRTAQSL